MDNPVDFDARGKEYRSNITAFTAGKLIERQSVQRPFIAHCRYELQPASTGSDLAITIQLEARGFAKIMKPIIAMAVWQTDKDQCDRIKQATEG